MKTMNPALLVVSALFFCLQTFAQSTSFVSSVDQDLTIKSVAVLPMTDNLSGIYANPLGEELFRLVDTDRQWSRQDLGGNAVPAKTDLQEKPEAVRTLLKKTKADALLESRLTKGPQGITLTLNLYSGKEGFLLAQASLQGFQGYEIDDLKRQTQNLYGSLKRKIPYDGVILSRKGNLVTVNLGSIQGVKEDQDLTVVQIVKIQRHPRFHFIVSSEKEILGRVHLQKVDENLSFGTIAFERSEGVLQVGQKFVVENFVHYPENPEVKDAAIAFGEKPKEWVPEVTPSFGKIGILFGLSQYTLSNNLGTSGGLSATNSFAPTIQADGELWFNPEWFAALSLRQFVFNVSNPVGSGSPGKLNVSTSQYSLLGGYNFLVAEKFFGPKIQLLAGYSKFSSHVDQSSPLTSFTSQTYSGLTFGFGGSFPLEVESKTPVTLGAELKLFLTPALDESPVDSGSSKNSITSFSAYAIFGYSARLNIKGQINYDLFTSTFSGTGSRGETASSSSHAITTLAGGIEYLF